MTTERKWSRLQIAHMQIYLSRSKVRACLREEEIAMLRDALALLDEKAAKDDQIDGTPRQSCFTCGGLGMMLDDDTYECELRGIMVSSNPNNICPCWAKRKG